MLNCESCRDVMADALYDPPDEGVDAALKTHLASCGECRAIYKELSAATEHLRQAGVSGGDFEDIPERASLDDLWQRVEPALDRIDAERYHRLAKRNPAPWIAAITALAATLIVFISVTVPGVDEAVPQPRIVSDQGVSPELMSYLDRAQVMLMQVANTESANVSGIPITQAFARNMALEANLLNIGRDREFNSGERRLLREIEFLLLQIANLDNDNMHEGVTLLQRYLEQNSVLYRIRLMEMRDQDLVL